jgi:hypothetical protein
MRVKHSEPAEMATIPERTTDPTAPVVPDELIQGDWRRQLVLPNQDGQLRLTPVKTVRHGRPTPSTQIRYLDDKRRHSA